MSVCRLASLLVPLFPLAARVRCEPDLVGEAVALVEGNGSAARVVAATRKARRSGVVPGLTLPQARALVPGLLARGRDREAERAAQEALVETAGLFSPRVEDDGEGLVYLDIGLPRTEGGRCVPPCPFSGGRDGRGEEHSCEREIGRELIAAARKAGLPVGVGIAASKLAARVAAGLPGSPVVVPGGEEARFLAPLPLERLAPEVGTAAALARWGIRSIGDLARLPAAEVASRLGETGRRLHETARGVDPMPLLPRPAPPVFAEGMELEWPVVTLEPFLALAEAALERLVRRLQPEGLACTRLTLALRLEPEGHDERAIALPAPTRDVRTLLTLVGHELEAHPPGAALAGFTLEAHPDRPRRGQLTLFGPPEVSPDLLATALSRLAALLGEGRAGSPLTVDGHLPERFAVGPYAPPPPPAERRPPSPARGLLAVRVVRPAAPLEVLSEEVGSPEGAPRTRLLSVRSLARSEAGTAASETGGANGDTEGEAPPRRRPSRPPAARPPVDLLGPVRVASGPWTLEEGWWTGAPADRDYWDVELEKGGLYRLYRDRASGAWFLDGVYD